MRQLGKTHPIHRNPARVDDELQVDSRSSLDLDLGILTILTMNTNYGTLIITNITIIQHYCEYMY